MTDPKKYIYNIPDDLNHAASKVFLMVDGGKDVLEIGCASGIQTRHLKEHLGCHVTGVEINPLAAEEARPYCESIIIGNIEELDLAAGLGDKRFDLITFVDVLEHLKDPASALRKVRTFLKDGGSIIASIPNIAHASICLELAHGRFDYQKYGLLDNTHIHFFTKKNVVRVFWEAGFSIDIWDRVVKSPEETEFYSRCDSQEEQSYLEWIYKQNPEANTYQFIVKASPASDEERESLSRLFETHDTQKKLEATIGELTLQNRELTSQVGKYKSQLTWFERNRFGPLSRFMSRLRK
ncbi:MAG: class I SAM-dependent methyltransferase [Gallionellaceae bacterium]|nr:class I SAM-dependent methyltransferase [Gallionellaceae bacterium]